MLLELIIRFKCHCADSTPKGCVCTQYQVKNTREFLDKIRFGYNTCVFYEQLGKSCDCCNAKKNIVRCFNSELIYDNIIARRQEAKWQSELP